jgi:hypothetical protein
MGTLYMTGTCGPFSRSRARPEVCGYVLTLRKPGSKFVLVNETNLSMPGVELLCCATGIVLLDVLACPYLGERVVKKDDCSVLECSAGRRTLRHDPRGDSRRASRCHRRREAPTL